MNPTGPIQATPEHYEGLKEAYEQALEKRSNNPLEQTLTYNNTILHIDYVKLILANMRRELSIEQDSTTLS